MPAENATVGVPAEPSPATAQTAFELELARAIAEVTNLELPPERIDPAAPIFGDEGLGLDSIDLLEVALVISQRYGFSLRSDDPDNRRIFASLRNLAAHIAQHRTSSCMTPPAAPRWVPRRAAARLRLAARAAARVLLGAPTGCRA
jgi:acyl carrier protein